VFERDGYTAAVLGKLLLYAMLMIVAFGLAFSGVMMLTVAPEPMLHVAVPFAVGGPLVGGLCLRQILVLNRRFQNEAWEAALADPSSVYARWTDADGRELMLAKSGLFIDKRYYYAFAESYSKLTGARIDGEFFEVETSIVGRRAPVAQTHRIRIPASLEREIGAAVAELRASLAGPVV
jgi:hypothetical protein